MEAKQAEIGEQIRQDCQTFMQWVAALSDEQFYAQPGGKWSAAEVMQHLVLSARPVARLLSGPRVVLDQWGRADQPPGAYQEIESAYKKVLATGVKAPAAMVPRVEDVQVDRTELTERFREMYDALISAVSTWSSTELDTYCIPHPVLGRLSVREMLYFTSIHTRHHLEGLMTGNRLA